MASIYAPVVRGREKFLLKNKKLRSCNAEFAPFKLCGF
jgi:hypothetical protein